MKKHAEYFIYQHPGQDFEVETLRNFLLTAFVSSDPLISSLLIQGQLSLPSIELYIENMMEKMRDRESTIIATDDISGAIIGCCLGFTGRQGNNLVEDIVQLFPLDMHVHCDLYSHLFQGISLADTGKVPMVVLNVTVSPLFRGQGIATKMLETLISKWKQSKQVDTVYVISTGNGSMPQSKAQSDLPKNRSQSHNFLLNLNFTPLKRIDYRKLNSDPQNYSQHLEKGLCNIGHHNALILCQMVLKKRKDKPPSTRVNSLAVRGTGTQAGSISDEDGHASTRQSSLRPTLLSQRPSLVPSRHGGSIR